MKEATIEKLPAEVGALVEASQGERIVLTRGGQPVAVLVGIRDKDDEDIGLEMSPEFWTMIEERRREPTVSLAEVLADLQAAP